MTRSIKVIKVVLMVLMVVGIVIAAFNYTSASLHSGSVGKLVTYYSNPPDCRGVPIDCYDLTTTEPKPDPKPVDPGTKTE